MRFRPTHHRIACPTSRHRRPGRRGAGQRPAHAVRLDAPSGATTSTAPANTLPSSANWIIDTGTSYPGGPANWGTGEIQSYTNSTDQPPPRRRRQPADHPAPGRRRQLDLGPHRDPAQRLQAAGRRRAARSRAASRCRTSPATRRSATGRRSGRWARPTAATTGTGRASASSTSWRTSTASTRSGACCTAASNPGGPCNETNGIGASRACPGSSCQSAFHTYRFEWDTSVSPHQLRWYVDGQQFHTVNQSQVGEPHWTQHDQPRRLLHPAERGHGRRASRTASPAPPRRPPAPCPACRCWSTTSRSTRRAAARTTPADHAADHAAASAAATPTRTIQAESFNAQSGVRRDHDRHRRRPEHRLRSPTATGPATTASTSAPAPPRDFVARVASGAAGGVSGLVEVRLDSATTPRSAASRSPTPAAGSPGARCPATSPRSPASTRVYLTFTSGQPADFVNVNWFIFRPLTGFDPSGDHHLSFGYV